MKTIYSVQVLNYKREKDGSITHFKNPFHFSCDKSISGYKSPVWYFRTPNDAMDEIRREMNNHIKWTENEKKKVTLKQFNKMDAVVEFTPFGNGLHCRKYWIITQQVEDEFATDALFKADF